MGSGRGSKREPPRSAAVLERFDAEGEKKGLGSFCVDLWRRKE